MIKLILFAFYLLFIWLFFFGRIKFNNSFDMPVWKRAAICGLITGILFVTFTFLPIILIVLLIIGIILYFVEK